MTSKKGKGPKNAPKDEPEVAEKKKTETPDDKIRVTVLRDHHLEFPELYLDVYISEGQARDFAVMFARGKCRLALTPDEADVVVFTGGPDVNPALYGAKPHPQSRWDLQRDDRDMALYTKCYQEGIPMVGICRGAQFLHVMNGGSLYQHVNNHVGDHNMVDNDNRSIVGRISSTHHQMVMSNNRMKVLGKAYKSTERWRDVVTVEKTRQHPDIEAFFYEDTCSLGFQGHPEFTGYQQYTAWVLKKIQDYIGENHHLRLTKTSEKADRNNYRLTQEFLSEREAVKAGAL